MHGGSNPRRAAASAHNIPVFEPALWTADQPWMGSLVGKKRLGGYAGPIGKVTGESLGKLLVKVLADTVVAENVATISKALSAEDGALNMHKFIERAIESFKYPWPTTTSTKEVEVTVNVS